MKNFRSYLALLLMGFLLAACSSDNVDLTWTFDAMSQTVTINMKNGEYGYKPGEPEYETMSVRILLANSNMMFGLEDGEDIVTLFRM